MTTGEVDSWRYSQIKTALGATWETAVGKKILMVGAGGIGCELLKNLVMCGFNDIEIIDLDTIDVSNLNRQFLFQSQHVKKSKAHVARETALKFNPRVKILSHHGSIYEPKYDLKWFKGFDIVLNALDNLPARKHVNQMCLAANVPLIESGTAGYFGQVSVHKKHKTHCFECEPKPTPKTFPVCTIRSTPSAPIHCIVWAKSYLFNQMFGKDDEEETQKSEQEDAKELESLKKETEELKQIKSHFGKNEFAGAVFKKIFKKDIERLQGITDMWTTREPPVALDFDKLIKESKGKLPKQGVERDQNVWSLEENFSVFLESTKLLSKRLIAERESDPDSLLTFDKDDDEVLDFVVAVSNLRSHCYDIPLQSRFKVKEMAGNIIPAIATTNAIIAGMIVMQAFKILNDKLSECQNSFLTYGAKRTHLITPEKPADGSLPGCSVCDVGYLTLEVDVEKFTLGSFVKEVCQKELGFGEEVTVNENGRLLYDPDFDDNCEDTLKSLHIGSSAKILVIHEKSDDEVQLVNFIVTHMPGVESFKLSGDRTFPIQKRPAPEEEAENESKKLKVDHDGAAIVIDDDGVVIL
ncbi:E1 ubiquitin-activating protein uba2 [Chytridiales sp. JEL 0842]|nr:E1 ubiquitin-activating protein uba2 [Chytridiales sp. JEL 0842]